MIVEYKISNDLSDDAREFIHESLKTSFNINSCQFIDSKLIVDISDNISEEESHKVIKKLVYISSSIGKNLLFNNEVDLDYSQDPLPYLTEIKDVKKIARGIFMFQGDFLKIFYSVNQHLRSIALDKFSAVEQEYPTLWPVDLFKKIDYFKEFPQQSILTTSVKNNYSDLKHFSDKYSSTNDYSKVEIADKLDDCEYGLEPSVCNTCYYALSNSRTHKNTIYTTYNKVFRNESSETGNLDRLMNFSVRDIMFVGDEQFVLTVRQQLVEELSEFIKYYHLDCKIESANDPFFSNDIARKLFQYSFGLKFELLANIPHMNKRIAIGSINLHLDTFGKAFDIRQENNKQVSSGCIGIGFERFVYALYAQHGHDVKKWPADLRHKLQL